MKTTPKELAALLGSRAKEKWNQSLGIFQVSFYDAEVMKKGMLVGSWGGGSNLFDAWSDYFDQIQGKWVVFNYPKNKDKIKLPEKLQVEKPENKGVQWDAFDDAN